MVEVDVFVEVEERLRCSFEAGCGSTDDVESFFQASMEDLALLPKVRAARAIRGWIDTLAKSEKEGFRGVQISLCKEASSWADREGRMYLKHRIQILLLWALLEEKRCKEGLDLCEELGIILRKHEEKVLLVEVCLLEARFNEIISNIKRAKSSLTACRTNSNTIHVRPDLASEIEFTAGSLAAIEREWRVSHSFYLEAFDSFHVHGMADRALTSLALAMMLKILDGKPKEVFQLAKEKTILPLIKEPSIELVLNVTRLVIEGETKKLEDLVSGATEVQEIQKTLFSCIVGDLLDNSILSLLGAYSEVDLGFIAERLKLDEATVSRKIRELILDGKLHAAVDEGNAVLTMLDTPKDRTETYKLAVKTLRNLHAAVDSLHVLSGRYEDMANKTEGPKEIESV